MVHHADGGPNEIPPVPEDGTEAAVFENAIRRFGVENACEWFGPSARDSYPMITIVELVRRSKEANNAG